MKIIRDSHFKQLEHFIDEAQYWDLDFKLLGTGGFEGWSKQLVSEKVLFSHARFQRGLDQAGSTPFGYRTFVILGSSCQGFWWRGKQVTQNDLLIFPGNNELHAVSYADFEIFTISVQINHLEQLIDTFGLKKISNNQEVVRMDTATAQGLRKRAITIAKTSGGEVAQLAAYELAEKLVTVAAEARSEKLTRLRQRDRAVDKVVEFIRNTASPSAEMAQLCRIANVSERTLQYAFKERYGIAPNVFIKRWNLNAAR